MVHVEVGVTGSQKPGALVLWHRSIWWSGFSLSCLLPALPPPTVDQQHRCHSDDCIHGLAGLSLLYTSSEPAPKRWVMNFVLCVHHWACCHIFEHQKPTLKQPPPPEWNNQMQECSLWMYNFLDISWLLWSLTIFKAEIVTQSFEDAGDNLTVLWSQSVGLT